MHRYWDSIIEPIITMIHPKAIVEIGSEYGKSTARLLEYCSKHQSKLYSIDPFPNFDVDAWVMKHHDYFIFHRSLSIDALPLIDNFDLIFIDGDHNWYTVFNELKLIEDKCRAGKKDFPLILFHDIGWPYGRRDLYYNPENIPDIYRKPYEQKGMVPGKSELLERGGLNSDMYNAVNENDQQNGVLTAIEDFIAQAYFNLELITIPGLYGLGVLIPLNLRRHNPELDTFVNKIKIDPAVKVLIEKIETDRILKQLAVNRRDDELVLVKQKIETIVKNHEKDNQQQQAIIKDKQQIIEDLKKQLVQTIKEVQAGDKKIKVLHRYIDRFETDFFAMLESRRWKIGNAIGELIQKIMLKKKAPMAFENIQKTFGEYQNWKICESPDKKSDNSYLSQNFLRSQCNKFIPLKVVDHSLHALFKKNISIIVPIYNAYDETHKCIKSILEHTRIPYRLILINDYSSDNRITELLRQYQDFSFIRIIENPQNLGFVKTVNLGIKKAKGDVVLLNSDTMVTHRWLQKLLLAAHSNSKIATVTPFSNASGAFSVPGIGKNKEIVPYLTLCAMAHIVERISGLTYPRIPTGNGFCMYIKRKVMDEIGLFDDVNFNRGYGEENDFCMRALKKGWQHIIDDSTFIYHKNAASFSDDKGKLIKENRKILDRLHPEYTGLVRKFIASPVLKKIRANIRTAMEKDSGGKRRDAIRILYVMHEGTGGTPATNQDLMQNISRDHECFLLTSDSAYLIVRYVEKDFTIKILRYKLSDSWSAKNFKSDEFRTIYFSLLVNLKIDIVHIRHLFKHSFELPGICKLLGLGVIFSFHDFYHICPSIHLLDQNNKYCNGQCSGTGQCRVSSPMLKDLPNLKRFLPEWQKAVTSSIIDKCDTFITTSEFTKKVYVNAYPVLKKKRFKIIEHGRDFKTNLKGCYTIPSSKSKVKILITGNIEIHKGSSFIRQLYDQDKNGRLELHFLGTIPKKLEDCGINHGAFERDNFYNEVSRINPSFIGIFSIWPETFCHTLTEAWACGIPVLGFNIGTVAERVSFYDAGWFLNMEDVKASYDQILDIAEKPLEYKRVLGNVESIKFKTTGEMADEYLAEYYNLMMPDKGDRQYKTIAVFTPHGANGFPGSSHIRCLLPLRHPDFRKKFLLKIMPDKFDISFFKKGAIDYVLVQRDALTGETIDKVIPWCKDNNIPLVYEIDDNFMGIDRSHPEYDAYKPKLEAVEKLCHNSDLTIVSTQELKKGLLKYQSNIQIIKNALDEDLWFSPISGAAEKKASNVVNVGYMGTYTHGNDLSILDAVIPEVKSIMAHEHGITMKFFMIGGLKDKLLGSAWYNRIHIPESESEYPRFVKWLRRNVAWDIALAPLENNELNRSKSGLKFLEYTALGAAGIYSDMGGYSGIVQHMENGLLIQNNKVEDWKSSLMKLAGDRKLRQQIVTRARTDVVTDHLLKQRVVEWVSAFDNVYPGIE